MDQGNFRIPRIPKTSETGAAQANLRIAGEFLAAMNARSPQTVGKTLHPDLQFVGPAGEVLNNRESFLETFHKVFSDLGKLDMTAEALSDNLIAFKYYMVMPAPLGPVLGTMRTTHAEDGLIKKIEMIHHSSMLKNPPKK